MDGAVAPLPSWLELWNEWEIQTVVVASFSLQVILFFFAGICRYSVSFVLKVLLWLLYLLADVVAIYALGHMSTSLSKKSSGEQQLVAFWAPFLVLHLGGQDTITAYALEDNELWRRHLLNMFLQVAGAHYRKTVLHRRPKQCRRLSSAYLELCRQPRPSCRLILAVGLPRSKPTAVVGLAADMPTAAVGIHQPSAYQWARRPRP